MNPSFWTDMHCVPPRRLPARVNDALDYLAQSLGLLLYETWTPTRLAREYPSMQAAQAALPQIFDLLLRGKSTDAVIQYWNGEQVVTTHASDAPTREAVFSRVVKAYAARFRVVPPDQPVTHGTDEGTPVKFDRIRVDTHIEHRSWVATTGRYFNRDVATNALGAQTDAEAVAAFLKERAHRSPHTQRAYREELLRLMRWCAPRELGPFSDLTRQNLLDYVEALEVTTCQNSLNTLSASSQARAKGVVQSLYAYLTRTGYLTINPALELRPKATTQPRFRPPRVLPDLATDACDAWLHSQLAVANRKIKELRRASIVALYRYAGIRLSELVWRDEYPKLHVRGDEWTLEVRGKGSRTRAIPLPEVCVAHLRCYRVGRGLFPDPEEIEAGPIVVSSVGRPLSASSLYREFRQAMELVAAHLPADATRELAKLKASSPHAFRHAYVHELVVRKSVPLPIAQMLVGHASIETTASYARTDETQLRKFVNDVFKSKT